MDNSIGLRRSAALRRIGAAGIAFFLVKGLLWLAAPFVFLMFT